MFGENYLSGTIDLFRSCGLKTELIGFEDVYVNLRPRILIEDMIWYMLYILACMSHAYIDRR